MMESRSTAVYFKSSTPSVDRNNHIGVRHFFGSQNQQLFFEQGSRRKKKSHSSKELDPFTSHAIDEEVNRLSQPPEVYMRFDKCTMSSL